MAVTVICEILSLVNISDKLNFLVRLLSEKVLILCYRKNVNWPREQLKQAERLTIWLVCESTHVCLTSAKVVLSVSKGYY